MTRATKDEPLALAAREIEAAWRALMSPAEAERIGPTTIMVMAHEAAKATLRARAEEISDE